MTVQRITTNGQAAWRTERHDWEIARNWEFAENDPALAARVYEQLSTSAIDIDIAARGLLAQARCLVKAEQKNQALRVLLEELATDRFRNATDEHGRLIQPQAIMRENDHIYFNTTEPQGRFIGTLNNNLIEGTWHEGILIWKMELSKKSTP